MKGISIMQNCLIAGQPGTLIFDQKATLTEGATSLAEFPPGSQLVFSLCDQSGRCCSISVTGSLPINDLALANDHTCKHLQITWTGVFYGKVRMEARLVGTAAKFGWGWSDVLLDGWLVRLYC